MFFLQEYTWDIALHQSRAYIALAIAVPMALALISQASRFRWAATTAAAVYTVALIIEILIFPLVSCRAEAGAGLQPHHAPDPGEVPGPDPGAGACAGPAVAAHEVVEGVADRAGHPALCSYAVMLSR